MAEININRRSVVKINRNGRSNYIGGSTNYNGSSFLSSGGGSDSGVLYTFENGLVATDNIVTFSGAYTGNTVFNGNVSITGTTTGITKAMVGLNFADNTSDNAKPVSIAQNTAIQTVNTSLYNHSTNYSNPHSVTKSQVGLGFVDNTSDTAKPVSIAQNTAIQGVQANLSNHTGNSLNPHSVTKTQVGLPFVDNTSDLNKPISILTQTALDNKAALNGSILVPFSASSLTTNDVHSTTAFVDGFFGTGSKLNLLTNSLTVDNLTVRNSMNIYELVINKIRATNGSLWVTDSLKTTSLSQISTYVYRFSFDKDDGNIVCPFVANDLIRAQRFNGKNIILLNGKVISINNTSGYFDVDFYYMNGPSGDLAKYNVVDFVRIGNNTDTARQGSLYITSSDTNAPYLDVLDGVNTSSLYNKTKVRLGKLNGITDTTFGALEGYGLYCQNGYFTGSINAGSGLIGGWNINTTALYKDNVLNSAGLAPLDYPFYAGNTYTNRATAPFRVSTTGEVNITSKCTIKNTETNCEVIMGGTVLPASNGSGAMYVKGSVANSYNNSNAIRAEASGGISNNAIHAQANGGGSTGDSVAISANATGGENNYSFKGSGDVKISFGGLIVDYNGGVTLQLQNITVVNTTMQSTYRIFCIHITTGSGNVYLPSISNFRIGEMIYISNSGSVRPLIRSNTTDNATINKRSTTTYPLGMNPTASTVSLVKQDSNNWMILNRDNTDY